MCKQNPHNFQGLPLQVQQLDSPPANKKQQRKTRVINNSLNMKPLLSISEVLI
jgi:hypothetical protein